MEMGYALYIYNEKLKESVRYGGVHSSSRPILEFLFNGDGNKFDLQEVIIIKGETDFLRKRKVFSPEEICSLLKSKKIKEVER